MNGEKVEGVVLVRDVMTKAVKTARVFDTMRNVVRKMVKFGIGCIIVVEGKRPVGIITERDILGRVVEPGLDIDSITVKDVMSSPVIIVPEDASVEDVARLLVRKGIKRVPVVKEGKLVGIITTTDIARTCPQLIGTLTRLLVAEAIG
jgi:CBS domain-containing protein